MKAKADFLTCGTFKVHEWENIRFWKDVWLGDRPLSEAYPTLFRIVRHKDDMVAKVLGTVPLNVSFRRGLINANRIAWFNLVSKVVQVSITNGQDVFRWQLTKNGLFTVQSMYTRFIRHGIVPDKSPLWKLKIPLKIKIFFVVSKKRGNPCQR